MFKKIAASVALALSLAACTPLTSGDAPAPVEVKTADTEKIRAAFEKESNKVYDFEKPYGKLKKIKSNKPKAVKPKTKALTSEDAALVVAEAQNRQAELEKEKVAIVVTPPAPEVPVQPQTPVTPVVPEVAAPVQPEAPQAPVAPKAPEVVTPPAPVSNWAQDVLNAAGYGHITVSIGDAAGYCKSATAVGCSAIGTSTLMLAPHLVADAPGMHVLWHEVAHATGISSECGAEAFAHQMTGNNTLWSYPSCR